MNQKVKERKEDRYENLRVHIFLRVFVAEFLLNG